jgi:hypothetical protein
VYATFNASAVVATRIPVWTIMLDGVTVWKSPPQAGRVAGGSQGYTWSPSAGSTSPGVSGQAIVVGIPDIWLPPGTVSGPVTTAIDVGDTWTGIGVLIEEIYATNPQLSSLAELRSEDYYAAEAAALAAAGTTATPGG